MVARMVHKRLPFLSVGMFLFLIDCAVVILAGLCVGLNEGLYAMIAIFVSSKLIDMVMAGLSQTKACFIITSALESVTQRVMTELDRGVTHLEAKGAYSGQNRPMILCVLSSQEVARLKDIVREEDEQRVHVCDRRPRGPGRGLLQAWAETERHIVPVEEMGGGCHGRKCVVCHGAKMFRSLELYSNTCYTQDVEPVSKKRY